LPPDPCAERRVHILDQLSASGIGFGKYFDPHLAHQQYFRATAVVGELAVTNWIARQIISLPLSDFMTEQDVIRVCEVLQQACRH
jgi:dTDP-4-amino-4,6-dideoxygalactose transaminase